MQGAVTSLRIIGEGVAAPIFSQTFSAGSTVRFEQAPFFLAAIFSFVSLTVRNLEFLRAATVAKRI